MDRQALFDRKPKTTEVTVDDLTFTIRKMTQHEVETARREYSKPEKALEGYRWIFSRVVVSQEGERVFEDADKAKLAAVDYDIITGVAEAAMRFSGLIKDDPKA